MRAVRVHAWGETPTVEELTDPQPAVGRTLVAVEAATVGHVDRTIWSGAFLRHPPLPYTPGVEGAGTVVQSEVFEPGERVWIRGGGLGTATDGTWAELVSAPDASLGHLPVDVDATLGAAFFSPCASAHVALHTIGDLRPGQVVLVTGAAGAVGSVACQLALAHGATVVGTVSRPGRLADLPPGVDGRVVTSDPGSPDVPEVDLLLDTVGGGVLAAVLPHVVPGGRAVLIGYVAGPMLEIDLTAFMQRDVSLHPLNLLRREAEGRRAAPELLAMLGDGRLTLDTTSFPFEAAADALAWLTSAGHAGRAVLVRA